jgi:predicted nucleic acid-binding protein
MNGNSVLLDTNIVLYLLSGDQRLSDLLYGKKLYLSFVTQLEALGYPSITEDEQDAVRSFLKDCIIIDINETIKEMVIRIKQAHRIKLPDSIILCTAKYLNLPLMTADDDFGTFADEDIIIYKIDH